MRLSKKFSELLLQYKAASRRAKSEIFQKMKKNATNFADWTMIYQYGDDTIRKDAQRKMEKLVLSGKTAADIQLNILELFLIIDTSYKDEILRKYLKKHHKKDDFLFAITQCDWEYGNLEGVCWNKLEQYYKSPGFIHVGVDARYKRNRKLMEKSTFDPWCKLSRIGVGEITLSTPFLYFISTSFSGLLFLPREHLPQTSAIQAYLPVVFRVRYFYGDMK